MDPSSATENGDYLLSDEIDTTGLDVSLSYNFDETQSYVTKISIFSIVINFKVGNRDPNYSPQNRRPVSTAVVLQQPPAAVAADEEEGARWRGARPRERGLKSGLFRMI